MRPAAPNRARLPADGVWRHMTVINHMPQTPPVASADRTRLPVRGVWLRIDGGQPHAADIPISLSWTIPDAPQTSSIASDCPGSSPDILDRFLEDPSHPPGISPR